MNEDPAWVRLMSSLCRMAAWKVIVLGVVAMSAAVAEDGSRVTLFQDSDNWAVLQAFLAAHTSVQLPEGSFPISQTLNIVNSGTSLSGMGAESTTIRLNAPFAGPVIGIGGQGTWTGGYPAANGVSLRGFTSSMEIDASAQNKCIYNTSGNDLLLDRIRVKGCPYEGIVSGNFAKRITLRNIEAVNCGNGGIYYAASTAGINVTSIDLLVENFVVRGCGQGVEGGSTRAVFRRGLITDAGSGSPSYGVNIGSTGAGVYDLTVEYVTVRGYSQGAMGCSNLLGRLAKVVFRYNDVDTSIGFCGGLVDNLVPHPDQGPTTYGSEVHDNTITIASNTGNGGFDYNSLVNDGGICGREPLRLYNNRIYVSDGVPRTVPVIQFAGTIGGACVVEDNEINGLDSAPTGGDIASLTYNGNPRSLGCRI
jgi:hypothetical protein